MFGPTIRRPLDGRLVSSLAAHGNIVVRRPGIPRMLPLPQSLGSVAGATIAILDLASRLLDRGRIPSGNAAASSARETIALQHPGHCGFTGIGTSIACRVPSHDQAVAPLRDDPQPLRLTR